MSLETELANHDWAGLEHMYGSAANIPDTLRAAKSTDKATRDKAVRYLYDAVTHQDDYESASPHVAAALVALITEPDVPNRPALLTFFGHLVGIATCYDVCGGDVDDDMFGEEHRRYGIETYQVGVAAIPTLMELASGPQAAVRAHAIAVLRRFLTEGDTLRPFLAERMAVEGSERVRAKIVDAQWELFEDVDLLRAAHDTDPSLLVRAMAAYHLAQNRVGDEVVAATLIAAIDEPELPIIAERYLPGVDGDVWLAGNLGHALAVLAPDDPRTKFSLHLFRYENQPERKELAEAVRLLTDGDAEAAVARLTALADQLPDDPFRLSYLALATYRATGTVADVTDRFPRFSLGWHHRSLVHQEVGDLAEALRAADRAIGLNGEEEAYYVNRSGLRARTGDVDGALADTRTAADRDILAAGRVSWG